MDAAHRFATKQSRRRGQIRDEKTTLQPFVLRVSDAQEIGRMNRHSKRQAIVKRQA